MNSEHEFYQINSYSNEDLILGIFNNPRHFLKYVSTQANDKNVNLLLILAGISESFSQTEISNGNFSLFIIIAKCIIIGGFFGWIGYYIYAFLLSWMGTWLKGNGTKEEFLKIIAYSSIPVIASLFLVLIQIIVFGNDAFSHEIDFSIYSSLNILIYWICLLVSFVLSIWSIILLIIGISELQQFSIGKSILNLILPAIVIIIPVGAIAFILTDAMH